MTYEVDVGLGTLAEQTDLFEIGKHFNYYMKWGRKDGRERNVGKIQRYECNVDSDRK